MKETKCLAVAAGGLRWISRESGERLLKSHSARVCGVSGRGCGGHGPTPRSAVYVVCVGGKTVVGVEESAKQEGKKNRRFDSS